MHARAERTRVDAAAGAMDHDPDVARVDVRERRRQQEQRRDEYDDRAEDDALELLAGHPLPDSNCIEPRRSDIVLGIDVSL